MLLTLVAVTALALAVQLAALRQMGRRRPVGDEGEYLERGASPDPQAPGLFLRPPLLPWLARLASRGVPIEAGEARLRRLLAAVGVLTVAVTAAAGWRFGGPAVALVAGLLLAVLPERVVLGCHIWPDGLLALWLAGLAVALSVPPSPAVALAAGVLGALGVLTRIDFLAAALLVPWAWIGVHGSLSAAAAAGLAVPPLLALGVLTERNRRRYGIALPDTTWAFNLMVARSEALLTEEDRFSIQGAVDDAVARWRRLSPSHITRAGWAALFEVARSPRRLVSGIVRRSLTLLGPDTFVRQRLLPEGAAYPELGDPARRAWDVALVLGFPLLVALLAVAAVVLPVPPPPFAWPSAGVAAAVVLFHARTRYRVALMPAVALLAARALVDGWAALAARPLAAAAALTAVAVVCLALLFLCSRIERLAEEPR